MLLIPEKGGKNPIETVLNNIFKMVSLKHDGRNSISREKKTSFCFYGFENENSKLYFDAKKRVKLDENPNFSWFWKIVVKFYIRENMTINIR